MSALEADGLVERERSDADRRVVLVRATPAGRALLERGRAARVRLVADLLSGLGDRDRQTLARAAEIMATLLSEVGDAPSSVEAATLVPSIRPYGQQSHRDGPGHEHEQGRTVRSEVSNGRPHQLDGAPRR